MQRAIHVLLATALFAPVLMGRNGDGDPALVAEGGRLNAVEALVQPVSIAPPGIEEIRDIAAEGFIYGLPLVMNYAVMNELCVDEGSGQYKAPFNEVFNEARVFTYKDTAVVTPNSDTPYSSLWLDLRAEPMVISVPAVPEERYYSVQLCDGNTYNYGYIGSRSTGVESGDYLVVGPGWDGVKPDGIQLVFQSTTPFALTIFRTQLFSADDMPNVVKVQSGYQARPLSAFLNEPAPPAAPTIEFVPASTKGIKQNFYEYLDAALEFVPETSEDKAVRARLATIGIGTGGTFDFQGLSPEHKAAVLTGMKAGDAEVDAAIANGGTDHNGWRVGGLSGGDRAYFNGNWLARAVLAKAGIYANNSDEAMYPAARMDEDGDLLDTGKHEYTLTFPAGHLPPVNAFWSVTMYDGESQLLIENPINRYLVNSPMVPGMEQQADGSLTIYIQNHSPGADKEANWLPAPNGTAYLVMRLYWPKTGNPSVLPPGEGSWQPPGIVKVQ